MENVNLVPDLNDPSAIALEQAKKEFAGIDFKDKLAEKDKEIDALKAAIATKDNQIKEYQELNQKLFLRVAAPIKQEDVETEHADPLVKSALDKIEAYNKSIEEKENNGSNN